MTTTKADFGTATQIVSVTQDKLVRYSEVNTPEVRKMGLAEIRAEIRSLQECLIKMVLDLERVVTEKAPSKGRTYKTIPLRDLTLGLTESDDSYDGRNTYSGRHLARRWHSMIHRLKTWPDFFRAVRDGRKPFEVRKADRHFEAGDTLVLEEFDPESGTYTHNQVVRYVTYVMPGGYFGVEKGFAVLGLSEQAWTNPSQDSDTTKEAPSA